jgi:type I restriction-modification system DNA methylase subunit
MDLDFVINHVRNRAYMSGIDRDQMRQDQTGEFFTPNNLVVRLLQLDTIDQEYFKDPEQAFVDPTGCGDGQFLGEVLIRKLENGIDFETAISKIYGCDFQEDNVELCRERLLCNRQDLRHVVENNIVYADSARYHHRYDGSYPYDDEAHKVQLFDNW